MWYEGILEKNIVPEQIIRVIIHQMIRKEQREKRKKKLVQQQKELVKFITFLRNQPIAIGTEEANKQHYELPIEFFEPILGKHMKYSCGLWNELKNSSKPDSKNLTQSEEQMLELNCQRAEIKPGQKVLDLGCGWGSLAVYMAEKWNSVSVTALTNSRLQKKYIEKRVQKEGLSNLKVIKANIQNYTMEKGEKYDRIVSIEMFEHMRNYQKLLEKLATFLKEKGKLFIHIFAKEGVPFIFDGEDESDWMAKYFFAGGTMPNPELLLYFQKDFLLEKHWKINGKHYQKTLNTWLRKMKKNIKKILPVLEKHYGKKEVTKWWSYWKVFFIANAEIFGWNKGEEWHVNHYLLKKR
jgi:cyclopropane-fatty-acyl-phospholipid synthase